MRNVGQAIFFNHYRVLQASGDPQAAGYLARAEAVLQEQAGRIDDRNARETFITQVRANRAIMAAARSSVPTPKQQSRPGEP